MSFIENVVKAEKETRVKRSFGDRKEREAGRHLGGRKSNMARSFNAMPVEESFEKVSLDEKFLNKQGFYTAHYKPNRLSQELRNIKRKLLRRLNFFKPEDTPQQSQKKSRRQRRQKNVILTTSSRPAEGKTFTAINLALSFAIEEGISTILIDADVPRPKVFKHFAFGPKKGLTDCIDIPHEDLSDYMREAEEFPVKIMGPGETERITPEVFSKEETQYFISEMSRKYPDHLIIVDVPPILATPQAVMMANFVDEVVFVVEANNTPKDAVTAAIEEIIEANENISIVFNKCLISTTAREYGSYEDYYYRARPQ